MHLIKALCLALLLVAFTPMVCVAEETQAIEVSAMPAAVKAGFDKEVPGGDILSAKKISGDVVTYRLAYKLSDKAYQITLTEEGVRTRKKKGKDEKK